jgi:hypothetical protein
MGPNKNKSFRLTIYLLLLVLLLPIPSCARLKSRMLRHWWTFARYYCCCRPLGPKGQGSSNRKPPIFMSNRLTHPGSRTCREFSRVPQRVHGMSDTKGQRSSTGKCSEHRHISRPFRLVRNPKNLKCFLPDLLRPSLSCSHIPRAGSNGFLGFEVNFTISQQWRYCIGPFLSRMGAPRSRSPVSFPRDLPLPHLWIVRPFVFASPAESPIQSPHTVLSFSSSR